MKILSSQYAQFTSEERLRLALAAIEREDWPELDRLLRSCPQVTWVLPDPKFTGPLTALEATVGRLVIRWLEVSVMIFRMSLMSDGTPDENIVDPGTGNAGWDAVWLGIEEGIDAFCTEAGLTSSQLLALAGGLPTLVEAVGKALRGNGCADRQTREATRQRLRQASDMGKLS